MRRVCMPERWRKPVRFLVVGPAEGTMTVGDRKYHETELAVGEEDWERIRTGYVCPQCMEPHERPFPKQCGVCGLARNAQQQQIAHMFQGVIPEGESLSDELARLDIENERKKHRPGSSVVLPRGVNLD